MENPRPINRCFYGLLIGILLVSVLIAVLMHDSQPLVWGLAVLLGFILLCGIAALINLAIFPAIFRLLARLTGRPKSTDGQADR